MFNLKSLLRRSARRPARVPEGVRVYAIGDVHGRSDLLEALLANIRADAATTPERPVLVFLGDYVDRGPDSKGVVDMVRQGAGTGWEAIALRGNHDQQTIDFCRDASGWQGWKAFGGLETLHSYGVATPVIDSPEEIEATWAAFAAAFPAAHREFLEGLPFAHVIGDYFFAHAGVRPGVGLDRQSPQDLMWIRNEFLVSGKRLEKVIVHGHTPAEEPVSLANRICVDTGAYATNRLTAVVLSGAKRRFLFSDGGGHGGRPENGISRYVAS